MDRTIIHVDMDAFFAAVEVRDNPQLLGKPLIIGALPQERGVVSTCSYEARKFGVRSAMSIKDAYRRCPHGIYMRPNPRKYEEASDQIHKIWLSYTDMVEYISLDEGFLDVTGSVALFGGAKSIGLAIKERIKSEVGLTCSVGIGYSMMSAKLASEEKKPDGFFEIPDAEALKNLIIDRSVRIIYGVGPKTAEELKKAGINTVRDVLANKQAVIRVLENQGREIINLAEGIDERRVVPYYEEEAKSFGKEHTFQHDTEDFDFLKDVLLLIAKDLSSKIRLDGTYVRTVTLKIKYGDMKLITRSQSGDSICEAKDIYKIAASLLDRVEKRPIRLVGITLSGFEKSDFRQMTFHDMTNLQEKKRKEALNEALLNLQRKYGAGVIKTGDEVMAKKRLETDKDMKRFI
ncbi:DNA polymerase-4/DNA polymerase IV (DinB-like DNA polymerase) [Anaerotaenia torta]|uniref:DNA polymerase IV n=1 Tax=Anaerotaenia torta TaxID=433293 RepID=UPI003D23832A